MALTAADKECQGHRFVLPICLHFKQRWNNFEQFCIEISSKFLFTLKKYDRRERKLPIKTCEVKHLDYDAPGTQMTIYLTSNLSIHMLDNVINKMSFSCFCGLYSL